jgi:hypothetical protein
MTIFGGCHSGGRLGGFRAGYLARHSELADGGRATEPKIRWVWVISVHDSQNIFADMARQRALRADNSELVW